MDRQDWILLRQLFRKAIRAVGPSPRAKFSDQIILEMYFWTVAWDRPLCWASDREAYRSYFRPTRRPSNSQFCRRIKTERFNRFLQHIHDATTQQRKLSHLNFLDGKPLPVGNYSQDPEAKIGWGAGQLDKGYKLHAVVNSDRRIALWSVQSMNTHEMPVAGTIIQEAATVPQGSVFMADGNYDAHRLHKAVDAAGGHLYVKPRGIAKHEVTLRQMGPARRELIKFWDEMPQTAQRIYDRRIKVEQTFSSLTCGGGMLGPLPGFVRRLERVRRWVGAKIVLYHLKLNQKSEAAIRA